MATIVGRSAESLGRLPAANGYGCHPDRDVALSRALTEAAPSRLALIAGTRDDLLPAYYRSSPDPYAVALHTARAAAQATQAFTAPPRASHAHVDAHLQTGP